MKRTLLEKRLFVLLTYTAAVFAGLLLGGLLWEPIPYVYFEYPSERCVRVVPAVSGTCEYLPPKYDIVWVSPRPPIKPTYRQF